MALIVRREQGGIRRYVHLSTGNYKASTARLLFKMNTLQDYACTDLMPRNLDRRVETLFPIDDPAMRTFIKEGLLEHYLLDTLGARRLRGDGPYEWVEPLPGAEPFGIQDWLVDRARTYAELPPDIGATPRSGAPMVSPSPD